MQLWMVPDPERGSLGHISSEFSCVSQRVFQGRKGCILIQRLDMQCIEGIDNVLGR